MITYITQHNNKNKEHASSISIMTFLLLLSSLCLLPLRAHGSVVGLNIQAKFGLHSKLNTATTCRKIRPKLAHNRTETLLPHALLRLVPPHACIPFSPFQKQHFFINSCSIPRTNNKIHFSKFIYLACSPTCERHDQRLNVKNQKSKPGTHGLHYLGI